MIIEIKTYTEKIRLLTQAIIEKRQVKFHYASSTILQSRVVNPHVIYIDNFAKTKIDCWQESGHSESKTLLQFKSMFVDKIHNIELLDSTFETNEKYNAESNRYRLSIVKIKEV